MTGAHAQTLDDLNEKYGPHTPRKQEQVSKTFESQTVSYENDKKKLKRVSKSPRARTSQTATGDIHAEMAAIQIDLTDLADEYGKLNVNFNNVIGKGKLYTMGEAIALKAPLFVRKNKKRNIKIEAARRRGDTIEFLVSNMAEVLEEQYQKAVEGKSQAENMLVDVVNHMHALDAKLIDSLKSGNYTTSDMTTAEAEVGKIEQELEDITSVLGSYEAKVKEARQKGDLDKVREFTDEMSVVLDRKYQVLDGKISAEGTVGKIRREMLDSAEGVQSAKGALAASWANYYAVSALIDAMGEMEIKYRHAKEDFIGVFKMQGKIAASTEQLADIRKTLLDVASISQRLMHVNAQRVTHVAAEVFDLLQTPLYDMEQTWEVIDYTRERMAELNEEKKEWAGLQTSIENLRTAKHPHYQVDN